MRKPVLVWSDSKDEGIMVFCDDGACFLMAEKADKKAGREGWHEVPPIPGSQRAMELAVELEY